MNRVDYVRCLLSLKTIDEVSTRNKVKALRQCLKTSGELGTNGSDRANAHNYTDARLILGLSNRQASKITQHAGPGVYTRITRW